jgi:hypothetical protein
MAQGYQPQPKNAKRIKPRITMTAQMVRAIKNAPAGKLPPKLQRYLKSHRKKNQ